MNRIIVVILAICVVAFAIGFAQPVGTNSQLVAPELQGNSAAQEIAALGIEVADEELGQDGNGYTVRGQTWYYVQPDGTEVNVKVILDDDVDPNSYDAEAILYHELGHIVNVGDADPEEAADDYAASRGYSITDAYHGIH